MKIAFNTLIIEITRKCQLQCSHCMRGDAQNINMDNETITTLLNKTSDIEYLAFTGGEPTLNIDGMGFFLNTMIKNNIHLSRLQIITNGVLLSNQFIELLKRYYMWIEKSNSPYKWYIILKISKDKYHQGVDVEKAINFYTEQLKDYPKIRIDTHKIADIKISPIGRAKDLSVFNSTQNDIYKLQDIKKKTKIEVLTKNNKTFCPLRKFEKVNDNEARILCPLELTAKGDFIRAQNFEYIEEDNLKNKICEVHDDILYWIHFYNCNLPRCIEFDALKQSIVEKRLTEYNLKKFLKSFNIYDILVNQEKWNKYVEKIDENFNNEPDINEISFEPTEQDVLEVHNELIELHRKSVFKYFQTKKHRQPTAKEIQEGIQKIYQGYEKILNT